MEFYKVIQPSPWLRPYVRQYWLLKTNTASDTFIRTVPTGLINMIFHRGCQLFSVKENEFHPRAFISGQETDYADLLYSGQVNMISVVFNPAGLRAFFDFPVNVLNSLKVSAGSLGDKSLMALEQSLLNTEDDLTCIRLIEQFLTKRLHNITEHNKKRIDAVIAEINAGQMDVKHLASTSCLSPKQFKRVFSEYVGSNPKEFSRTIRFQKALFILQSQPEINFAGLAADSGFYDQSHMIKDFKALSGYTPKEYLDVCPPQSDYFSI